MKCTSDRAWETLTAMGQILFPCPEDCGCGAVMSLRRQTLDLTLVESPNLKFNVPKRSISNREFDSYDLNHGKSRSSG